MTSGAPGFGRRFLRLYMHGLAGIATLPLVLLPLLRARPPATALDPTMLALLALIQPAVLLAEAAMLAHAGTHLAFFGFRLAGIR